MTRAEYRAALKGRACYVGMDLSSTKDLTALVAVFPDEDGFDVLAQFFIPKESIKERVNRDRVPYDQWARDGFLIATPGNVVDYEAVRETLKAWGAEFQVRVIAFDPWNATDLVTRIQEQDGFVCAPMRQSRLNAWAGRGSMPPRAGPRLTCISPCRPRSTTRPNPSLNRSAKASRTRSAARSRACSTTSGKPKVVSESFAAQSQCRDAPACVRDSHD
jgi:hypothetical protein